MSYGGVENTPDDLEILEGATILSIGIVPPEKQSGYSAELAPYMDEAIVMRVRFRKGLLVNDSSEGEFQVWQDVEGNGPGYLSFTGP